MSNLEDGKKLNTSCVISTSKFDFKDKETTNKSGRDKIIDGRNRYKIK